MKNKPSKVQRLKNQKEVYTMIKNNIGMIVKHKPCIDVSRLISSF